MQMRESKNKWVSEYVIIAIAVLISATSIATALSATKGNTATSKQGFVSLFDLVVSWPTPDANLFESQVFLVRIDDETVPRDTTRVFWDIEGGVLGGELTYDGQRYAGEVDTSQWDWKKDNKYLLTFNAINEEGVLLSQTAITVAVGDVSKVSENTMRLGPIQQTTQTATVARAVTPPPKHSPTPTATVATKPKVFSVEWVPQPVRHGQKFIFHTEGYVKNQVNAFWKTEGGHMNMVYATEAQEPFMALINMFGWHWKGAGPYTVSFILTDKNTSQVLATEDLEMRWKGKVGESDIEITSKGTVTSVQPTQTTPAPAPQPQTAPASVAITPQNAPQTPTALTFSASNVKLYTPFKPAVQSSLDGTQAPVEREALSYILQQPNSIWLNGDGHDSSAFIQTTLQDAKAKGQVPVFVLYNIPNRDCGSHSSGGAKSASDYRAWVDRLAGVFAGSNAMLIVEPDALPQLNCVPENNRNERLELIRYAVERIGASAPQSKIYIDAGHPFWVNAGEMASRLTSAGVQNARGFALNISNYASTRDNVTYGTHLSNLLGGKRYVIDTSRSGNGESPSREWCNPSGRALGETPRMLSGANFLDALLWVKYPGESDGQCNGGPSAGAWWKEYAVSLYTNRI